MFRQTTKEILFQKKFSAIFFHYNIWAINYLTEFKGYIWKFFDV